MTFGGNACSHHKSWARQDYGSQRGLTLNSTRTRGQEGEWLGGVGPNVDPFVREALKAPGDNQAIPYWTLGLLPRLEQLAIFRPFPPKFAVLRVV